MLHESLIHAGLIFGMLVSTSTQAAESCEDLTQQLESGQIIQPRLDVAGNLIGVSLIGTSSLPSQSPQFIANARVAADMEAKAAFSNWLNQEVDSLSASTDIMITGVIVDESGNTEERSIALSSVMDTVLTTSSNTLSQVVRTDECQDHEKKMLIVKLQWKAPVASTSTLTPSSTVTAPNDEARNFLASENSSTPTSVPNMVVLDVEGIGPDLETATNAAIRQGISQVFGETFHAESQFYQDTTSAIVDNADQQVQASIAVSSTASDIFSVTQGVLDSYEYLLQEATSQGIRVIVRLNLPKYESIANNQALRVIVTMPNISVEGQSSGMPVTDIAAVIQQQLKRFFNAQAQFVVLDREFSELRKTELETLVQSGAPARELVRLGNTIGADLMVAVDVNNLSITELHPSTLSPQLIRRELNADIEISVIEVATSSILHTDSMSLHRLRVPQNSTSIQFAELLADRINLSIARHYLDVEDTAHAAETNQPNVEELRSRARARMGETRNQLQDDF